MDLLEEMLRCRDDFERLYTSESMKAHYDIVNKQLNESIDKIITEGMQKRRV